MRLISTFVFCLSAHFLVAADAIPPAPPLLFDETEKTVTGTDADLDLHAIYRFRNVSGKSVVISEFRAACGCTQVASAKKSYAPEEMGEVTVDFHIGSRAGKQSKRIEVVTADGASMAITLVVYLPAGPTFSPAIVSWLQGSPCETRTIAITLPHGTSYHIVAARASSEQLRVNLKPGLDDEQALLDVTPLSTEKAFKATVQLQASNDKSFTVFAHILDPVKP